MVLRSYLFGAMGAVVITIVLEMMAMSLLYNSLVREYDIFALDPTALTFVMIIVVAPITEEAAKTMGVSKSMTWSLGTLRSDLVLGTASGLGFTAIEKPPERGGALFEGGSVRIHISHSIRYLDQEGDLSQLMITPNRDS